MKKLPVIILLLMLITIVMARNIMLPVDTSKLKPDTLDTLNTLDTIDIDSLVKDTLSPEEDSIRQLIIAHNKAIDDSLHRDSLNRKRKNGIDSPVHYQSNDSMVYLASDRKAYLYGDAKLKYQDMDLESENVDMSMYTNIIHATGVWEDTTKHALTGTPIYKMGADTYESDTMFFNYKTKKGLITNVTTQQDEGIMYSQLSKRNKDGNIFLRHGRYTTCDAEHPDFYIAISRAKMKPGKEVIFGPAHLVVADVPLPLIVPYGFFPFSKSYSSGFIMPTYGDDYNKGFYLRDGGYYFAMSDKWDLKLVGEIYTKGSWGISAASNYNKRYKFGGSVAFSFQDSRTSESGMPDYSRTTSYKFQWTHHQDAKANPYSSLSASVNFASTAYERNNLNSLYNPQALTQSTRTSSVSWQTSFSSIGLSLSASTNLSQNMRDSTIAVSLPDLNINLSRFYPFKRKHAAGKQRWYEKISVSYTGRISNSITAKENHLLHANFLKEWSNGWKHSIPISASFTLFKYLNVTPSFNFNDRTYFHKISKSWDVAQQKEVADTTAGFHNVYDWNLAVSMNTKLYGFFIPNRKLFGEKIQAVRHVLTPSVSFSYAPDFGSTRYGYYTTYQKTDADGNVSLVEYSPYQGMLYGVPGKGKTGSVSFSVDNNIEMKIKTDKDSTGYKKISIIDDIGASMSYNMAAQQRPWSDLSMKLRLKLTKSYTFNMNAVFATYAYELDQNGKPYLSNHTEWSHGRFGRFQGTSQNISFTLSPENFKKWFGKKDKEKDKKDKDDEDELDDEGMDTNIESNIDDKMVDAQKGLKRKEKKGKAETDEDGYMPFSMPWSLTVGYGITMRENTSGTFNTNTMRYPYKFTQNLNLSGFLRIADGWNISFSSGYDFENKKISMTTASLSRDLHCFQMTCSVVLAPYTSYNFSFRCNAATLTDLLKYDKRSSSGTNVKWY